VLFLIPGALFFESVTASDSGALAVPERDSGYRTAGDAADSAIQVVILSGLVGVIATLLAIVISRGLHIAEHRFLRRKPLLIFTVIFIVSALVLGTFAPLPISDYHGTHTRAFSLYQPTNVTFVVYPAEQYRNWIEISAEHMVEENERIEVSVQIVQGSDVLESLILHLNSSVTEPTQSRTVPTGQYEMAFDYVVYQNEVVVDEEKFISIEVIQPVAEGHLEELAEWDTYRFVVGAVTLLLLVFGVYADMLLRTDKPPEAPY
jgi:hypothetical protein